MKTNHRHAVRSVAFLTIFSAVGSAEAWTKPDAVTVSIPTNKSGISMSFNWSQPPGFSSNVAVEFKVYVKKKCFVMPPGGKDNVLVPVDTNLPGDPYDDPWNYYEPPNATTAMSEVMQGCGDPVTALGIGTMFPFFKGKIADKTWGNFSVGVRHASDILADHDYYIHIPVSPASAPDAPECSSSPLSSKISVQFQVMADTCTVAGLFSTGCPFLLGFNKCEESGQTSYNTLWDRICAPGSFNFTTLIPWADAIPGDPGECVDGDQDQWFAAYDPSHPSLPMYGSSAGDCDDNNPNVHPLASESCANGSDDNCDGLVDCDDSKCVAQAPCCGDEGDSCCSAGDPCNVFGLTCDATKHCALPQDPCFNVSCPTDNNICNGPEKCVNGACVSGPTLTCPVGKQCYPSTGCGCVQGSTQNCPYAGPPGTLGVGVCSAATQQCANGIWGVCVGGAVPASENCIDGLDNDCDGKTDAADSDCGCPVIGAVQPCYTGPPGTAGVGVCSSGTKQCLAKPGGGTQWSVCTDIVPAFENCYDALDNDCDGWTDCQDSNCMGMPGCSGNNGSPETCNGLDDNGNGQIDEGDPGGGAFCSTGLPGICGAGIWHCLQGSLKCTQTSPAVAEVCGNGLDDDCDGVADDGCGVCVPGQNQSCYSGPAGTLGVGACKAGQQQCWAGGIWSPCAGEVTPGWGDTCTGLDDDCDGLLDCADPDCSALPMCAPVCVDADGDGYAAVGSCPSGTDCNDNNPQQHPGSIESCNGQDDNCNGQMDEGNPGGGASCSTGLPGVCMAGTLVCQAGSLGCVESVPAGVEVCDGVDNDCDGATDEGCICAPGATKSCYSGPAATAGVGQCAAGLQTCGQNGNWLTCVGDIVPQDEICDGFDNNCDGTVEDVALCGLVHLHFQAPPGKTGPFELQAFWDPPGPAFYDWPSSAECPDSQPSDGVLDCLLDMPSGTPSFLFTIRQLPNGFWWGDQSCNLLGGCGVPNGIVTLTGPYGNIPYTFQPNNPNGQPYYNGLTGPIP